VTGPAARRLVGVPGASETRRQRWARSAAIRLLEQGQDAEADEVVGAALERIESPQVAAGLLSEVIDWGLSHGRQPALATQAVAALLTVADQHLALRQHNEAAGAFERAMRVAFHRVLHFDHPWSPLADNPAEFTAPLRKSEVAQALRAPRGRLRRAADRPGGEPARPTRLLIITRKNADFLGEIREHFEKHPDFETRFVDFPDAKVLTQFSQDPTAAIEQLLAGRDRFADRAERLLLPHLDWADVVFVEWCTSLAALMTFIDPRDTRVVVRLHSYEAFTQWPQLMDFGRVDDVVFVSEHLRDLAAAAIPALSEPGAPRLHVLPLAMELQRFRLPKPATARFTVGVVGASKVVKDPRWALDVLRELRRHDERYRLQLLRGKLQHDKSAATQEYADRLALDLDEAGSAVRVLGHTDDVPTALEHVGVVLSSSIRESFHIGLVEGAASGAVPVVRNWPYFPGAARSLFPPEWVVDSPQDAAQRILEATASEEKWQQAGREASEHVIGRWDWPRVRSLYEDLLRTS
jgi:glycosyltransferase involved in cell wall biosynthesis